jgi:hypothetical protein
MPGNGYYSSEEKDIVRQYFDLPLLEQFHRRKQAGLRYFGLPGASALDIRTWKGVIQEVSAVERYANYLEQLEQLLDAQFPEIRYTAHWGELDKVILTNRGKRRMIGNQEYRPRVGNVYEQSVQGYVWRFDVVNLDYFGPFLPPEVSGGADRARERARALQRLFNLDRVDAWQSWILLITVEAKLYDQGARALLRTYLEKARHEGSEQTRMALDFLLAGAQGSVEEAARLIHGATAVLVAIAASSANLVVQPRGTVVYRGAHNQPMIHLAFGFEPSQETLAGPVARLPLLRTPILRPRNPQAAPWFEPLPQQCPGLTADHVRMCLDFLDSACVKSVVSQI